MQGGDTVELPARGVNDGEVLVQVAIRSSDVFEHLSRNTMRRRASADRVKSLRRVASVVAVIREREEMLPHALDAHFLVEISRCVLRGGRRRQDDSWGETVLTQPVERGHGSL